MHEIIMDMVARPLRKINELLYCVSEPVNIDMVERRTHLTNT